MIKHFITTLLFIYTVFTAAAQEEMTSPTFNPIVARQYSEQRDEKSASTPIKLPVYDDFSVPSVYPSPAIWSDKFAFVNTDFAKNPPSVGVATLDVLNDKGELYTGAGQYPFDADYLTSLAIRLDSVFFPVKKAISRKDSVYISFFYQPQGRSISPPSKKSSLILEFHSPLDADSVWNEIWSTAGGIQVDTFAQPNDRYFHQVLIPISRINDSIRYYKNGFKFRFRNIAALAANSQPDWRNNGSQWNIDMVELNTGRNINDTLTQDIAFGDIAPSMLLNYESMPMKQYRNNFINEMKDTIDIKIANLYNIDQNVSYKYNVRKNSSAPYTPGYDGGSFKIKPFLTYGYCDYQPFARPPVNFFYPISNEEGVVFYVTHMLTPDLNPLYRHNDSIQFQQKFSNYYAYDNGSSEAGIGINGTAGYYAVKFKLNIADTMRGMQIYFNPVVGGLNKKPIDLIVWNDTYGLPGSEIKKINDVIPIYSDNNNEFVSYWFDSPLLMNAANFPGLIFYIGWKQTFLENLNVGLDRYIDSHVKRFYNVNGTWENSSEINAGSLMMRPIIGPKNPLSINENQESPKLSFSPNPVSNGKLVVKLPDSWKESSENTYSLNLFSATGQNVLTSEFSNPVDVSGLASGLYILVLTNNKTGLKASGKIIIRY